MAEILSIGELLDLGGSASTAGLIPFSALEYSSQVITGISGSAIGGQGGTDSATVSAIASAYAESAASGKLDTSAFNSGDFYSTSNPSGFITGVDLSPYQLTADMSAYQPSGDYAYNSSVSSISSKVDQSAFDECCSAMSAAVSSKMDASASGNFVEYMAKPGSNPIYASGNTIVINSSNDNNVLIGDTGMYLYGAGVSAGWAPYDYAANAPRYVLNASGLSGIQGTDIEGTPQMKVDNSGILIKGMIGQPNFYSAGIDQNGPFAYNSAGEHWLTAKLDASASSQFQPSGDYAYNSALGSYQPKSSISAWTGEFQNISGKVDKSAISAQSSTWNTVSSKLDETAFTAYTATAHPKIYTGVDPIVVDNDTDRISLSATSVHLDSSMTAYTSGGSGFIGVNADFTEFVHTADMSGYIPTGESSKYQLTANMTGWIPTSESSKYYSTSNPSSFATTAQLESGLSGKLDSSAQVVTSIHAANSKVDQINGNTISATVAGSAQAAYSAHFALSGISTGGNFTISSLKEEKLDASAQVVTALSSVNSLVKTINGMGLYSARYAGNAESADYVSEADVAVRLIVDRYREEYIDGSSVMPKSASSNFYLSSNPSGFIGSTSFGFDGSGNISSIDGSALAGADGVSYTSPSGTIDIDNAGGTMDIWNSSKRVDSTSIPAANLPGTASAIYSSMTTSRLWTGSILSGDRVTVSATGLPDNAYPNTASAVAWNAENQSSVIWNGILYNRNFGMNSAVFTADAEYTAMGMMLQSQNWTPTYGLSGVVNVERDGHTVVSTSVYEQVLKDSMWNSLTAWAAAQGWTP